MQVKTISSSSVGPSRWNVVLEAPDGKQYKLQTVDADIAAIGFSGEVKSYESEGAKFVAQAAPEVTPLAAAPAARKGFGEQKDDRIRAQWAIGQALAKVTIPASDTGTEAGKKKLAAQLAYAEKLAIEIFNMVDNVKGGAE
jgi:hypothetical protein